MLQSPIGGHGLSTRTSEMDQSCRTSVLAVGRALTYMNKEDNDVSV